MLTISTRRRAADDDFVTCLNAPYGQVLVLPCRRLVRPAAANVFFFISYYSN